MANERIKATKPMLCICFVDGENGVKTRCLVEKWTFVDKFMGEQSITFSVSSAEPIDWHVGDYCEFRGERYTLNYIPSATQKARKGSHGEAFTYEGVKLESYADELTRCQLLDITPTTGLYVDCVGTNHTGSSNFTLYCGETRLSIGGNERVFPAVCVLAGKIQANLDRLYGAGVWSVLVETNATYTNALGQPVLVTHTDAKLLSFDNKTVADALSEVHNTFDLDYCIKGRTIYIGYSMAALSGTANFTDDLSKSDVEKEVFYFGYGKGYPTMSDQGTALFQLKRIANSQQKIVTRLRVLGSTKNLPYRYYNERYSNGNDDLSQTLFPLNLQLPGTFLPEGSSSDAAGTDSKWGQHKSRNNAYLRRVKGGTNDSYIDKNDDASSCIEGIREASVRFDGSDSNLPEIYPTIEDATYSELREGLVADQSGVRGNDAFPGYSDGDYVDELLAVGYPSGSALIDDANKGSGILPESGYTGDGVSRECNVRQTSLQYRVQGGTHDFSNWGDRLAGPEVTLCTFRNITPGRYALATTSGSLFYRFSGISCYRDGCSAKIGFMLRIKQKYTENGVDKSTVLFTYTSSLFTTQRSSGWREIAFPDIPSIPNDENAEIRDPFVVTQDCLLEVTLIPIMRDVSVPEGFVDNFAFTYEVGNSKAEGAATGAAEYTLIDQDEASALAGSFHVFVKDMGFDIEAQWTGDTPTLTMRSGSCTGRAFEIGSTVEKVTLYGKKGYLLTLKRAEDSSLNTYYPSRQNPLASGDKFVLTGISMPDAYVQMAELRLLKAATQYLADNCETVFTYQPYIDDIYLQRNYDKCLLAGHEAKSIFWRLYAGLRFTFRGIPSSADDEEILPLCDIAIEQVTIKMGESALPQVELLLNDDVQQTTLQKLTTSVDRIYNGSIFSSGSVSSEGTAMNTAAFVSLLQSEGDKRFLSKRTRDEAAGHITFADGITVNGEAKANDVLTVKGETRSKGGVKVGDFRSRLLGSGALIDESGNAEFESIYARNFFSTPEFRFNGITVTDGEEWCTNGYGTVKSVEQTGATSGIITLQLEENDYASVALGDLCRGIYNNFGFSYQTADLDDDSSLYGTAQGETSGGASEGSGFGFSSRQGYFTSYFCIVCILTYERGSCSFEYELRNSHTPHPCKFMRFAQYGNRDPNSGRCSSSYQSSVGRYFEMILDGVTTWKIQSANVVLRKGYLGNMTVTMVNDKTGETYDQTLEGYGLYVQNNVYSNKLIQVDPYTLAMLEEDLKSYTVELTEHVDVITVDDAGNVIGGLYTETGEGANKVRNWRIHSAISVFKNNDILRLADAGEEAGPGTYTLSALKRDCDCFFDNSTIYITKINNLNDGDPLTPDISDFAAMRSMESCCVDITIDCEGMGTIVKRFPITVKHSSEPVVSADLDNEFSGVSWNSKRGVYIGLPVVTELTMWRNNEYLDVTGIAAHLSQPIQTDDGQNVGIVTAVAAAELTEVELATKIVYTGSLVNVTKFAGTANEVTYKVGRVEITRLPKGLPKVVNLNITGTALYSGVSYERTLVHTINKSTDTNVYQIVPSVSEVSVVYNANREKVPTVRVLRCGVKCSSTDDQHFDVPVGGGLDQITNYLDHGMMLIYCPYLIDENYVETAGDVHLYHAGTGISIGNEQLLWRRIEFTLLKLKDATLSDFNALRDSSNIDAVLDTEDVPLILDGLDGVVGIGFDGTTDYYAVSASQNTLPTGCPASRNEVVEFTDTINETTGEVIHTAEENFLAATNTTVWTTGNIETDENHPWLWNFEKHTMSDGSIRLSPVHRIGSFAKGIKKILEFYAVSDSADEATAISGIYNPLGFAIDYDEYNWESIWGMLNGRWWWGSSMEAIDEAGSKDEDDELIYDECYSVADADSRGYKGYTRSVPTFYRADASTNRSPRASYPYQWNWERVVYTDGSYEDFFHISARMGSTGPAGASGDTPIGCYRWYKEGLSPTKPTDTSDDEPVALDYVSDTNNARPAGKWNKSAPNRPADGWELWMCQSVRHTAQNGTVSRDAWSNPVRISGSQGTPGEDAEDREWIYKQSNREPRASDLPVVSSGVNGTVHGVPTAYSETVDDWVPDGWTDNPQGVDEDHLYEWACYRDKARGNGASRPWSGFKGESGGVSGMTDKPIIWCHYGERGIDGDGMEYVFIRTKTNAAPVIAPNYSEATGTGQFLDSNLNPYYDEEYLPVAYLSEGEMETNAIDIRVDDNWGSGYGECTDDAKGVSAQWPFEWVAIRKMSSAVNGVRKWNLYSGSMKIWAKWGFNSIRIDLDNEMDAVAVDSDGVVLFDRTVSTRMRVYDGSSLAQGVSIANDLANSLKIRNLAVSDVSAAKAYIIPTIETSNNVTTISWVFERGMKLGSELYNLTVAASYNNGTYNTGMVITARKGEAVYQLLPSMNEIVFARVSDSDNTLTPNSHEITCGYTKTDAGGTKSFPGTSVKNTATSSSNDQPVSGMEYDAPFNIFLHYQNSDGSYGSYLWLRDQSNNGTYGRIAIPSNTSYVAVEFVLSSANSVNAISDANIIDRETFPILKNGSNGKNGVSMPQYIETEEAWGSSDSTPPADTGSNWKPYTPANPSNLRNLWRRSRLRTLNASGTGYDGENGVWTYMRLNGTDGTKISTQGEVMYVADSSGNIPTTGFSTNDLAIVVGSSKLYKATVNNGTASWALVNDASNDGDCYIVAGSCTYDGEQVKGHMWMWSAEAKSGNGAWIDLGPFKGDDGKTYYTHVAWADTVTFNLDKSAVTAVTGFSIGIGGNDESKPWMGVCIDENANDSDLLGSTDVESANHFKWKYMKGKDGEDSADREWIYYQSNLSTPPPIPESTVNSKGEVSPSGIADGTTKWSATLDDWVPNGWTDHPQGVSDSKPYEYACYRDKARGTGERPWSKFKGRLGTGETATGSDATNDTPMVWSHFGERGTDGDGFEYVFARTKRNSAPQFYADASNREDSRGKTPLQDDYLPRVYVTEETAGGVTVQTLSGNGDGSSGAEHTGWNKYATSGGNIIVECTDEPVGTSEEWPYEWVLTRRKTDYQGGVRSWEAYSGPMSHWTNWAKDGAEGIGKQEVYIQIEEDADWDYSQDSEGNYNHENTPTIYDCSPNSGASAADKEEFQSDSYTPWTTSQKRRRWTEYPSGVSANRKYEFKAMRKKVGGVWGPYGKVMPELPYTVDGVSPYLIDLSNENSFVNCEQNGEVSAGATYEESEVLIYLGGGDKRSEFTIKVQPHGVSCNGYYPYEYTSSQEVSGQTRSPETGFVLGSPWVLSPSHLIADAATIVVTATKGSGTGATVLKCVFKVNKNIAGKGGVVYSIVPSLNVIHRNYNGSFRDTQMSVHVTKVSGDGPEELTTPLDLLNEDLTLLYDNEDGDSNVLVGPSNGGTLDAGYLDTLVPGTLCGNGLWVRLVLLKGATSNGGTLTGGTVVDKERLSAVTDGEPGSGDDGESYYLTGTTFILKDADGNFKTDATPTITGWKKIGKADAVQLTSSDGMRITASHRVSDGTEYTNEHSDTGSITISRPQSSVTKIELSMTKDGKTYATHTIGVTREDKADHHEVKATGGVGSYGGSLLVDGKDATDGMNLRRGINLIVLNPLTFNREYKEWYDVYADANNGNTTNTDNLISALNTYGTDGKIVVMISGNYNSSSGIYIHDRLWAHLAVIYGVGVDLRTGGKVSESLAIICQKGMEPGQAIVKRGSAVSVATVSVSGGQLILPGASVLPVGTNIIKQSGFRGLSAWEVHDCTVYKEGFDGSNVVRISPAGSYNDCLKQEVATPDDGGMANDTWYTLSFYASGGDMLTYFYDMLMASSERYYLDGVSKWPGDDVYTTARAPWSFDNVMRLHRMTFKTKSRITYKGAYDSSHSYSKLEMVSVEDGSTTKYYVSMKDSNQGNAVANNTTWWREGTAGSALQAQNGQAFMRRVLLMFRKESGTGDTYISKVKLEEGPWATGWQANESDRQGMSGCRERVFEVYTQGMVYYNEETTVKDGVRYVDFMAIEDAESASGYAVYRCKRTHTATASSFTGDLSNWETVDVNYAAAFFTYLIAKNAHLKFLSSNAIEIIDNETVGGVSQRLLKAFFGNGEYPLWLGGTTAGDGSDAPFHVKKDGKMFATGATVSGVVTADILYKSMKRIKANVYDETSGDLKPGCTGGDEYHMIQKYSAAALLADCGGTLPSILMIYNMEDTMNEVPSAGITEASLNSGGYRMDVELPRASDWQGVEILIVLQGRIYTDGSMKKWYRNITLNSYNDEGFATIMGGHNRNSITYFYPSDSYVQKGSYATIPSWRVRLISAMTEYGWMWVVLEMEGCHTGSWAI